MEFQRLLKEQASMKVVLNGGKQELEDATVPFSIGFSNDVAEQKPTHVLVIAIHHDLYKNYEDRDDVHYWLQQSGERKIYELSKINFIQFNKPGKYNLVFILMKDFTKASKRKILQEEYRGVYQDWVDFGHLERLTGVCRDGDCVSYCEELIEVPEEFFALAPKTGLKKLWWSWVNRWHLTSPIDECEFRKRVILATTIQPVAWVLGFLLRFLYATIMNIVGLVVVPFAFLCGCQVLWEEFANKFKTLNIDFLFLFRKARWGHVLQEEFMLQAVFGGYLPYKQYAIGKYKFKIPISPMGLAIQLILGGLFFLFLVLLWNWESHPWLIELGIVSLVFWPWHTAFVIFTVPHEKAKNWIKKREEKPVKETIKFILLGNIILIGLALLSAVIGNGQVIWGGVPWALMIGLLGLVVIVATVLFLAKKIGKFAAGILDKLFFNLGKESIDNRKEVNDPKIDWYKTNMSLESVPDKIDFKTMTQAMTAAPTKKAQFFLKFKVGFWRAKTKVCRPYVK